ncbi:MAG TPA: cyclic nucleotide-binding domain-containing protein [Vicinamibacterales bacterium]|nr:cyclic nucleotide-binding domain-containing protein [Vicinamibacterales bacterium]
MHEVLKDTDLFRGFSPEWIRQLSAIGRSRVLAEGDYLFLLGDSAECIYVVVRGKVDLCLPMRFGEAVRDVPVESAAAGKALGWSGLVKPYRFTLSARAAEPSEAIGFSRSELHRLFGAVPELGNRFLANLSELVGLRLLTFQALWVRELQRALEIESAHRPAGV